MLRKVVGRMALHRNLVYRRATNSESFSRLAHSADLDYQETVTSYDCLHFEKKTKSAHDPKNFEPRHVAGTRSNPVGTSVRAY